MCKTKQKGHIYVAFLAAAFVAEVPTGIPHLEQFCSRPHSGCESSPPQVKKPSIWSILLALIPFCGMCFSVRLWDRLTPHVLGLPFNLFWIMAWNTVTPILMYLAYQIEKRR